MIPLLWVDVETTGLDPRHEDLLEIALVATDKDLKIEAKTSIVLFCDERRVPFLRPEIREMHQKNGLFAECARSRVLHKGADVALAGWVKQNHFEGRPMAGSNPPFDRAFLTALCPDLATLFHYRAFDMNTVYYYEGIDKDAIKKLRTPIAEHRALGDILGDLEALKALLTKGRKPCR